MVQYRFGPFTLEEERRLLRREGEIVPLTPKVFELLCVLVKNRGRVLEKERLLQQIWQGAMVEESNLSVNISTLRKALGETHQEHQYVVTHSGKGYSFVADVVEVGDSLSEATPARPGGDAGALPLAPAGGAMPLESSYYIQRGTDVEFGNALARRDSIILVKGSRQVGKTSLLARGFQEARRKGARVLLTDFQDLNAAYLESAEKLLLMLAELLADELELRVRPSELWNPHIGPSSNFERYWKRVIFAETTEHLIWGMDEADRLFHYSYASEIFGLFRSWHNKRALDPTGQWARLTLTMAYATEAHLFITDLNQSPFNVGTRLSLEDFTLEQVMELNQRYGSPLRSIEELSAFCRLVGGHPFLVHHGLREIKTHGLQLQDLTATPAGEAIFADHLERLRLSLMRDPELREAVREILASRPSPSPESFYRLRSAGVIKGASPREAKLRCELYQRYLRSHSL